MGSSAAGFQARARRGLAGALSWRGTVGRVQYAAVGTALVALKYGLDSLLARTFGREWTYFDYWSPTAYSFDEIPGSQWPFFASLLALSLPFLLAGLSLTVRRLRDAGAPPWLVALFFVPVVNLLFFVVVSLLPPRGPAPEAERPRGRLARLVPESRLWSAVAAVVLTAALGLALTAFATEVMTSYGAGLFLGVPFVLGLLGGLVYSANGPRTAGETAWVGLLAALVAALALMAVALEGAICVVMALPLALPFSVLGALAAYALRRGAGGPAGPPAVGCLLVLPLLLAVEGPLAQPPGPQPVRTSIVVDAPPEIVWKHVVSFPDLPPPRDLAFRAGIAYPVGATIDGQGVGAVRRCRFSTGDFVEPITVWDEPFLLRFDVTEQPPPLRELSPWGDIRPPHLDAFLVSRQGEFRLARLPDGRTRLEGTTWYENRLAPGAYWRLWSDELIGRIHLRVLEHVARLAEAETEAQAQAAR